MTVDEYVRNGIDELMANAAAHASGFTDASGALVLAFLDAADVLVAAWNEWLAERVREEDADGNTEENLPTDRGQ